MLRVFFTTVFFAFVSSVTTADTFTVCLDGSCEYSDIQSAINAASNGDVIEIAAGTYYPAATIDTIGKAVTLRGEIGKDDAPTTVIDGQDSIRVLICENEETALTVFENLLITGGMAGGNSPDNRGGGMYNVNSSSPTLMNCTFEGNSADFEGGGMFNNSSSSPTLTDCTFTNNSANYGGGMRNYYNCSPTLENCTFEGNSASYGGGMSNRGGSSPTLTNCTFTGNSASPTGTFGRGGGMYNAGSSSPTLTNCTFTGNSAFDYGGGMSNTVDSSPTLTDCTFTNNSANYGGGMSNRVGSSPTLTNCTFAECCQVVPPNSFFDNGGNDYDSWCDECRANVNCVGEVDAADLGLLLSAWNTTEAQYDIDGDGVVGGGDLGMLLGSWGVCP